MISSVRNSITVSEKLPHHTINSHVENKKYYSEVNIGIILYIVLVESIAQKHNQNRKLIVIKNKFGLFHLRTYLSGNVKT